MSTSSSNAKRFFRSLLDPRAYLHMLKIVNFYNYSHVSQLRDMTIASSARLAPNASFREGKNITIGERTHIGERCMLWAGDALGRINIGNDVLLGPEVMLIATNYTFGNGAITRDQPKHQAEITIGDNVWIGARCVITAGVSIGEG